MWVCLNDAFLSIVAKDCARDELLVRARRPGDIEKLFPGIRVEVSTSTDYRYRARIRKREIIDVLVGEVMRITYSNFKDSVTDNPLHDAYMRVWTAMSNLQPVAPYGGRQPPLFASGIIPASLSPKPKRKRQRKRSLRRGV